jgi:uncharacterized protein
MQKAVEIESRGLTLRGMIHIPEGISGKVPMIPIFHGFTGNKMEPHFIFVKLSRILEKRGIASVRFDFGGSGESDGDFIDMTISKELEDAKNILEYAKTLDFADVNKIGIVGLSMGGAVASMLAGDCKDDIKALCLWAPAGNMADLVMSTIEKKNMDKVRKSGYYDLGGLLLGTDFIDDVLNLNIYEKAAAFNKNVLLLHGDKDVTVPLNASEKYLDKYETKAVLHVVEGADHTFNNKSWEDEVIEYTLGFFEGEFR